MAEYIVSARKYRPMTFDSVVGQKALTTTLKIAVKSGKLAHAYLFCGPRGVGKTTCARIFAKAINCENPSTDGEPCEVCESCKAFNEQRSYNIFELDAASNNGVEQIKSLIEQTRIPPQVGRYKVFIIDEVHMLSTAAFNAFLKTLEEPPANVIFILATTEKHKILPTIISRCQIYDFERMSVPNIINHLKMVAEKEGITYEEEALNVIAEKADGGMRDALSVFDQAVSFCQGNITYKKVIEDLNVLDTDNYFDIIDYCLNNDTFNVMVLLNNILNQGFDGGRLIGGLAVHVRNLLMAKDKATLSLLQMSQRQIERYKEQAKNCPVLFLYNALKIMNDCDINYRQSSNKRLLVELTLIEIAQIIQSDGNSIISEQSHRKLEPVFTGQKSAPSTKTKQVSITTPSSENKPVAKEAIKTTENNNDTNVVAESNPQVQPNSKPTKLKGMTNSFSNMLQKNEDKTQSTDDVAEIKEDGEKQQFNDEKLALEWTMMCNRMPKNLIGLASRLKNVTPTIKEYPNIEIVVDNQLLLDDMLKIKNRILKTLVINLKNSDITINYRLAKPEEIKHIPTNQERFDELKENNKAFKEMTDMLDLVLE
ncbi:MAG: DNA polymerase III subunit gamma/tau [Prevotella sp.]|nr:DNA polymerase III subunit gamma/tau [Prevotella sp.]